MVISKRLSILIVIPFLLLLIPFVAMQFSTEVNWSIMDFLVAGTMLLITVLIIEFILRKAKTSKTLYILATVTVLILLWIQLAVGLI